MTSSFVLGSCHIHKKSQSVHNLALCVNTIGVLDHTYPELSVARATLVTMKLDVRLMLEIVLLGINNLLERQKDLKKIPYIKTRYPFSA